MPANATPPTSPNRDFALDFVRAIAIVEVVLAHAAVPPLLFQLRNFGVPLLLVVSGMAFALSYRDRPFSTLGHIVRRLRRLLLPTWGFLVFFFALLWALNVTGLMPSSYDWQDVINNFLLQNSAGYVWVIRVNLLIALIAGVLVFIDRRTNNWWLVVAVLTMLAANEALHYAFVRSPLSSGDLGKLIKDNAFYALSYGAMFLLGMRIPQVSRLGILALVGLAALVFGGIAYDYWQQTGLFVPTQSFKYPPRAYYIAYALMVGLTLLAFRHELAALVPNGAVRSVIGFVGANTLWIYLWHILVLRIIGRLADLGWFPNHWAATWIATVILAVLATWLHQTIWRRMIGKPSPAVV